MLQVPGQPGLEGEFRDSLNSVPKNRDGYLILQYTEKVETGLLRLKLKGETQFSLYRMVGVQGTF